MTTLDTSTHALLLRAKALNTTLLFDRSYEFGHVVESPLTNYTPGLLLAGPAFVVEVSNSILPILQALSCVPRDHVLVVVDRDARGNALLGDIIMTAAGRQGVAGFIVHGKVRDVAQAGPLGMPLWALGAAVRAAPLGPPCATPPTCVYFGGLEIRNGDWVIGDSDGLICIRGEKFRFVVKAAEIKRRKEEIFTNKLREGRRMDELVNLNGYLRGAGPICIDF